MVLGRVQAVGWAAAKLESLAGGTVARAAELVPGASASAWPERTVVAQQPGGPRGRPGLERRLLQLQQAAWRPTSAGFRELRRIGSRTRVIAMLVDLRGMVLRLAAPLRHTAAAAPVAEAVRRAAEVWKKLRGEQQRPGRQFRLGRSWNGWRGPIRGAVDQTAELLTCLPWAGLFLLAREGQVSCDTSA